MNTDKHIIKHVGSVTSATMISRIFGFIRDALVAYLFGATVFSDAFYVAYRIANLFRRLFGEGAFSSAFIPVFASYYTNERGKTKEFLRVMMGNLLSVVLFLTFLGIVCAPVFVRILALGFRDNPEQLALTITLARIMFPYFIFISLAACIMGVLQTHKIFFIPALAPVSLSISIITYIVVIVPLFCKEWTLGQLAIGLSVSVLVGGVGQWLWMIPSVLKKGYSILPKINFTHTGSKRVFGLMIPAMMGISVDQINMFISATFLASFLAYGSITSLYYSDRLTQFPLALFGIAIASVALPLMSKASSQNCMRDFKETLSFSIRMIGYLVIPSAVGLIVMGIPIIIILFQRGVFDERATHMTYAALIPFSIGMVAFSLIKILANAFYALQDTKRPMIIASICMCINVILSIILMRPFGVAGLAAASATSAFINVFFLIIFLRKKIGMFSGEKIVRTYGKIIIASLAMGGVVWVISRMLSPVGPFMQVLAGISAGCIVYMGITALLHIEERKHIITLFRRRTLPDESF